MVEIEMPGDEGNYFIHAHRCTGDVNSCLVPATCEDCGWSADEERPVFVFWMPDGEKFFLCESDLATNYGGRVV